MAVIYNDKVCVLACDVIRFDEKYRVGSETGLISKSCFDKMRRLGQLIIARRSTPGNPALVEFETMRPDIKRKYVEAYGDPYAELASRDQQSELEKEVEYNNRAYTYFQAYRYGDNNTLPQEKVNEYTLSVNVMEALLRLRDRQKQSAIGGSTRINVWERLGAQCQSLLDVKDAKGKPLFPHHLPASWKSLKRKCEAYEEARKAGDESGFRSVIHKNYGNDAASKLKERQGSERSELAESLIRQFLGLHMNWNNVQVMQEYNKLAAEFGLEEIKSPATIGAYRQKYDVVTKTRRRGIGEWNSNLKKQVRRSAPLTAMTLWVFDGWDVEMLFQREEVKKVRKGGTVREERRTTYHNRKTIVVVLDACCKYPIGYAIGENECDDLIKEALTNAVRHTRELFGERYIPVQMQCDNYHKKSLFPFYEQMTKYLTPAEVKNAQAKIVEPYFKYLILEYFQKFPSFSGFGITSSKEIQPNVEWLNEHRKFIPTEQEAIRRIHGVMQMERAKKIEAYMKAWSQTPDERKMRFSDEQYLLLMGQTSGRTNKLESSGIIMERNGMQYVYDSLDRSLLDHLGTSWVVRYDPDDTSRVLITNAGKKGTKDEGKEIGTLRYLLSEKEAVPMALIDQKPEHFEQRRRINEFNESLKKEIVETAERDIDTIRDSVFSHALPVHNILERFCITDSRGQHKDNRNELRLHAEDVEYEENDTRTSRTVYPDDDDDYEFSSTDAGFSR